MVYDLDNWPKNSLKNFTLKNCLFGLADIAEDNDKKKYVYCGYGKGEWGFDNDYGRNVIIFGVDNSSSFHTENLKNDFLVLGEGDTFGINGSFGAPVKKTDINFSKSKTKFCLTLHYNSDNSLFICKRKRNL